MSKNFLFLLNLVFSLFFISSCHYIAKKSCAGKSWAGKKGKSCCAGKSWAGKKKKSCCGQSSVAGKAVIQSAPGGKIKGEAFFAQEDKYKVKVTANVSGLKANQTFGFHVHEFGICENNGLLAGAHLNPWRQKHGGPQDKERHLGDLGNLKSNAKGQAKYTAVVPGKLSKFLGRSVIIHAMADDLKSQPTGNSGERIACGVILARQPPSTPQEESKKELKKQPKTKQKPAEKKPSSQTKGVGLKAVPAVKQKASAPLKLKKAARQKTAPAPALKKSNPPAIQKAVAETSPAPSAPPSKK